MSRRPALSLLLGAVVGSVIAIGFTALFGAFTALETVSITTRPVFVASQGGLTLLVLFCGAVGGLLIAAVTYGFDRIIEPQEGRFPLRFLIPGAMVLSAAMSYAVVSLGTTLAGDVEAGVVTVPVPEMVGVVMIAGAIAGVVNTPIVDALARPVSVGPRNQATPPSSRAFWSDLMGAVGVPVLAALIVASLAIGFSQLLLSAGSTVASVAAFGGMAFMILGGTALIALRPWDRS